MKPSMLSQPVMDPFEQLRALPRLEPSAALDAKLRRVARHNAPHGTLGRFEGTLFAAVATSYAVHVVGTAFGFLFG